MKMNRNVVLILIIMLCGGNIFSQGQGNKPYSSKKKYERMHQHNRKDLKNRSTDPMYLSEGDKRDYDDPLTIIEIFESDAPKNFNIPDAPRFTVIGKNKKFYFGVGGYLKGTASFDFCNPIKNPGYFITSQIPVNEPDGNGGLFQMSAATSTLAFNFVSMPHSKHRIGAYINFNFENENYGFDLQHAYLTYMGFLMGYDYSLAFDGASAPPTIDMQGPPSLLAVHRTVLNYIYNYKNWHFALGFESPEVSYATNQFNYRVNQRIPDIPAYAEYTWDKCKSSVRLTAIMRNMQYRDVIKDKNYNKTAWGLQLTGTVNIYDWIQFYYQGLYGNGIANMVQDLEGLQLDMVPSDEEGKLELVELWGAMGGIQFDFSHKLFSSHTYSQVRNYANAFDVGTTAYDSRYRYAQYIVNNVFWKPIPCIQVGLEYIYGRLTTMNNRHHSDNRIQTMFKFNF